jgi:hypothetical protein
MNDLWRRQQSDRFSFEGGRCSYCIAGSHGATRSLTARTRGSAIQSDTTSRVALLDASQAASDRDAFLLRPELTYRVQPLPIDRFVALQEAIPHESVDPSRRFLPGEESAVSRSRFDSTSVSIWIRGKVYPSNAVRSKEMNK